jgi:outer membrane protein assembly factor BamB
MAFGYNVKISVEKELKSTSSGSGLMDSAWPMFQHDTHHTGRSPYTPQSGNWPVVKWKFWIKGMTISSPAIDENGVIYIGSHEFHDFFFAINPDGSEKWRFDSGDWVDSSPAIAEDGTIYFGCLNGRLFAVNPNGSEKWWRGLGDGWVFSSPVIDDDGVIYAASVGSSRLCAVYPNGTIKWKFHANDWIYSSPAIDTNEIIYIGSHDDCLYAIYPNGTMKWKYKTNGELKSSPAIGEDGTIYVCSWDYYLYAIYPNGTLRWKYDTGSWTETSPTIAQDGTIYVGNYVGRIFSIDPNGNKNWHYDTGDSIYSSPAVDKNGVIYVGSMDGYLYALNPDGTLKWKFLASDDGIQSSVAIAEDGTIYIAAYFKPSGGQGAYTYLYALEVIENQPPVKPTISGQTSGKVGQSYQYTFKSTDPDGDQIYYYIDWGDGDVVDWDGPHDSGVEVAFSHTWSTPGDYQITCKAKDPYEAKSDLGTLKVTMPRSRAVHNILFLKLLEQFPILRHLLRL